jgi:hypothetical protein
MVVDPLYLRVAAVVSTRSGAPKAPKGHANNVSLLGYRVRSRSDLRVYKCVSED